MTEPSIELELDVDATAGGFRIQSRSGVGGECAVDTRWDPEDRTLERRLRRLHVALLSSAAGTRRVAARDEKAAQELGTTLFDLLFTGDVRTLFDTTRQQAALRGSRVRLVLRVRPPELAALPWEFLYDQRRDDYLGLSMPLVRFPEVMDPVRPLRVEPPLRVVALSARPRTLDEIDAAAERANLETAISGLDRRGRVTLDWATGETWRDLLNALGRGQWHVLHLVGHGAYDEGHGEGVFFLATEGGASYPLRASRLAQIAALHPSLGLIVLNSCESATGSADDPFSSTATTLIRRGVPAVLAMQFDISDRAAVEFTRSFYAGVASGLPLDVAVRNARLELSLAFPDTLEWGTPVLFLRQRDGQVFEVPARSAPPRHSPSRTGSPPTGSPGTASPRPAQSPERSPHAPAPSRRPPPSVTARRAGRRRVPVRRWWALASGGLAVAVAGVAFTVLSGVGGTGTSVAVPANVTWTGTGVVLQPGQHVRITASGRISPRPGIAAGPEGLSVQTYPGLRLLSSSNYGALIGRIGGAAPFEVGAGTELRAPGGGELYLGTNDLDAGDSTGEFTAQVAMD
ncbi:CHAT domain-containing protein [Paractinoplanes atraurantiacus]|uniref:CHAT domain-containing protein n=2 Tax=Paractinoplanes atraurantiacus TaxID=1036182 RepID=A0A285IXB8_9ACTN|nr:CHAT domain-containing protein [Actinoplanes atraurantiacus]